MHDTQKTSIVKGINALIDFSCGVIASWIFGMVLVNVFNYHSVFFAFSTIVGVVLTAVMVSFRSAAEEKPDGYE